MNIDVFALAASAALTFHAADPPFPMRVGDTWTYDADVAWTESNSNQTRSAKVPWTMKIVDVVEGPHARAAVVEGLLLRLAWYDPTEPRTLRFDVIPREAK